MNREALFKLSYGLFVIAAKTEEKENGCIINTVMQVTDEPLQLAVTVNKLNYTHDMLVKSRTASLSVLSVSTTFDTIRQFGFKSGKEYDKFVDVPVGYTKQGLPYLKKGCCAWFDCKITDIFDLGTHSLFLMEILEDDVLSTEEPLTYAEYHKSVKPAPDKILRSVSEESRSKDSGVRKENDGKKEKIIGWRCVICGYVYEGEELPADFICPWCKHGIADFEKIVE